MNGYRILKFLIVIMLLTFIIFAGCGAKKETKAFLKEKGLLCSFEIAPSETSIGDFDWETNGFVKLEQFKKYATHGKHSAKAIFSIPEDFLTTTKAAKVDQWLAGITISISTLTKLKVTDWSKYKKFGVDIYVPDNKDRVFYIKLIDNFGNQYITSKEIKNGRNKLDINLEDVKSARINTQSIVTLSLYIDTKGEEKDVILFIDNVRLIP